jgi:hypothetical protein
MTKTKSRTWKTNSATDPAETPIERAVAMFGPFDGPPNRKQDVVLCKRSDWPKVLSENSHLRRWAILEFKRHIVAISPQGPAPLTPERRAALSAWLDAD